MSDEGPSNDGLQSVPQQDHAARRRVKMLALVAIGFVVVVVVVAVVVLVWRPWQNTSCADDGSHVADEETGLCYLVPDGWEREETGAGEEGSAIVSVDGSGLVMVAPVDDRSGKGDVDLAARMQAALLSGNGPGNESIRTESATVDGHASATSTYSDAGIWVMVTVIDLDGSLAGVSSVCPVDETERIDQIEEIHDSLRVLYRSDRRR